MTNKENYKRVFNVLAASNPISLEVNAMKNKKKMEIYYIHLMMLQKEY